MPRKLLRAAAFALCALAAMQALPALAASRIKDIVSMEGVRSNPLIGQGLVVGLNGTGDNLRNCPMTQQMFESMLEKQGSNVRDGALNTKNIAHVQVTAQLPPFAAPGAAMDITVSSSCDAKSLLGGTLLATDLRAADGNTYALGQGTVQTGSVSASGASGSSVTKGVPTAGRIASGAIVEKDAGFDLSTLRTMHLTLRNPDFTTSQRIAGAINGVYAGAASADNPAVVTLRLPSTNLAAFLTSIESLQVDPDTAAKVTIDEVSGVVGMTEAVRISRVALMQGNIAISVLESPAVSQPQPFSRTGTTEVVPQTQISVEEEKGKQLVTVEPTTDLADVVKGLNSLGVTPRDMIAILQSIKKLGALQADIEVM